MKVTSVRDQRYRVLYQGHYKPV